jgi:hypothetical protein
MGRLTAGRPAESERTDAGLGWVLIGVLVVGAVTGVLVAVLGKSSSGNPPAQSSNTSAQDDTNAQSNLQTSLTVAKTYYTVNNQSYAGLNSNSFATTASGSAGVSVVDGSSPSTGPSVISLLASGDGSYAVLTAWAPASSTCWAIFDSTSNNNLDGQSAFTGTLYIASPGPQSACSASTFNAPNLPAGSTSSISGF